MAGAEARISTQRFALVGALRGFAALFVVLHHASEGGHVTGLLAHLPVWVPHLLKQGDVGVAVFLVLSGFVISHSVARSRVTLPFVGRFMLRRSLRLEPPYWLAIALVICLAQLSARVLPGRELPSFPAGQIAAHISICRRCWAIPRSTSFLDAVPGGAVLSRLTCCCWLCPATIRPNQCRGGQRH